MRPATTDRAATRKLFRPVAWTTATLVILAGLAWAAMVWQRPANRRLGSWLAPTASGATEAAEAYRRGDWERAADLSRALLKTKHDSPEVVRTYARASARLRRDLTATVTYNERLGSAQMEQEDFFLLGSILRRAGEQDDALRLVKKAAATGPDNPEVLSELIDLAIPAGQLDPAADAARQLAAIPGWEARGLFQLGEVEKSLDNPKGAVEALRQALAQDAAARGAPDDAAYYRKLLARSLLQLGRPAEARQALESVIAASGPSGADAETSWLLSRALLVEGRLADARAALERAGAFREDHPLTPEPGPFVGSAKCAPCHAEISGTHERSRHARTFHHGKALLDLPLPRDALTDPDDPKVTHTFTRDQGHIEVKTQLTDQVARTVVEYAFGVTGHYITMIGRDDERNFRALRLSSYPTASGTAWGRTSGDVPDPQGGPDVRGAPIQVQDGVVRCLYCHVTRSRDFRDPPPDDGAGPTAADAGIGCERCHGPGANHLVAVKAGFPDLAIVNAANATAAMITAHCGDCHKVGRFRAIAQAPGDPRFIRSTAATLTFSRCYTQSNGGMTCLTCHDPHAADRVPTASYEARCIACHSQQKSAAAESRGRPCPVNPASNCLECHMPKVPVPALHTSLTDHFIRIRKPGK
jgi:tetratricopeptide (TPR) repeat protein